MTPGTAAGRPPWQRRLARIVALAAVAAAVALLLAVKGSAPAPQTATGAASAAQSLDQALADGRPILAFFHSRTCASCIQMMSVVDEVYPEFQDAVAMVDVDAYDPQNEALLRRERIVGIPTVILVDRTGQRQWFLGVMGSIELHDHLAAIAGGG